MNKPPTIGAAIGFITSETMPLSYRMGARLGIATATLISLDRSFGTAPSMIAASTLSCVRQLLVAVAATRVVAHPIKRTMLF